MIKKEWDIIKTLETAYVILALPLYCYTKYSLRQNFNILDKTEIILVLILLLYFIIKKQNELSNYIFIPLLGLVSSLSLYMLSFAFLDRYLNNILIILFIIIYFLLFALKCIFKDAFVDKKIMYYFTRDNKNKQISLMKFPYDFIIIIAFVTIIKFLNKYIVSILGALICFAYCLEAMLLTVLSFYEYINLLKHNKN